MKPLFLLIFTILIDSFSLEAQEGVIMTVRGPIPSSEMGLTLIHEHVLVDFIGADKTGSHRWNRQEVIPVVLPFLEQAKGQGVKTIVECTPAYIGRDPLLLKELSEATGIHLITNTGYYGASDDKYLPQHAYSETADQLAARWFEEWEEGIDGTGIRPGFIKIGVNAGSLSVLHTKLIRAAALTHLQTGLTIASHTGPGLPAFEQLNLLEKEGVSAEAFIWVHAQGEKSLQRHVDAAQAGAWVSLDGLSDSNQDEYLKMLKNLKNNGFLNKTLISHDAGWYSPGEENGGEIRGYTVLPEKFVPLLLREGFTQEDIRQLLVVNPQKVMEIRVRTKD